VVSKVAEKSCGDLRWRGDDGSRSLSLMTGRSTP
jgi:hypothetical protein